MKTIVTLCILVLTFFGITSAEQLATTSAASPSSIQAKLDAIILPKVTFVNATLTEAVEFLCAKSSDLDTATEDPKLKGVNFIIKVAVSAEDPTK